jgi:hypothetical protein
MRHTLTRADIFCTLRRAYDRVDDMRSSACANDAGVVDDLRAEESFVKSLEAELDMHSVWFARGFWRMFTIFIESAAFHRSIEELAAAQGLTTRDARLLFFNSFTQACETLERVQVPRSNPMQAVGRWMQRRRNRAPPQSVDSYQVVCMDVIMAHIRWRNQSGHMLVYEILSAEDPVLF